MATAKDGSMAVLERKLEERPDSLVFSRLADSYRKRGDIDRAIAVSIQGLSSHPSYVTGHIILGRCYVEQDKTGEAIKEFSNACRLDRHNVVAIKMLADIFAKQGMEEKAGDLYDCLRRLEPSNSSFAALAAKTRGSGKATLFDVVGSPSEPVSTQESARSPSTKADEAEFSVDIPEEVQTRDSEPSRAISSSESSVVDEEVELLQPAEDQEEGPAVEETVDDLSSGAAESPGGDDITERMGMLFDGEEGETPGQQTMVTPGEPAEPDESGIADTLHSAETMEIRTEDLKRDESAGIPAGDDITSRVEEMFGSEGEETTFVDEETSEPSEPGMPAEARSALVADEATEEPEEEARVELDGDLSGEDVTSRIEEMFEGAGDEGPSGSPVESPEATGAVEEAPAAGPEPEETVEAARSGEAGAVSGEDVTDRMEEMFEGAGDEGSPGTSVETPEDTGAIEEAPAAGPESGETVEAAPSGEAGAVSGEDVSDRMEEMFAGAGDEGSPGTSVESPEATGAVDEAPAAGSESGETVESAPSGEAGAVSGEDVSDRMEEMFAGAGDEGSPGTSVESPEATGAVDEAPAAGSESGETVESAPSGEAGAVSGEDVSDRMEEMFAGSGEAGSSGTSVESPEDTGAVEEAPEPEAQVEAARSDESGAVSGEDVSGRMEEMFEGGGDDRSAEEDSGESPEGTSGEPDLDEGIVVSDAPTEVMDRRDLGVESYEEGLEELSSTQGRAPVSGEDVSARVDEMFGEEEGEAEETEAESTDEKSGVDDTTEIPMHEVLQQDSEPPSTSPVDTIVSEDDDLHASIAGAETVMIDRSLLTRAAGEDDSAESGDDISGEEEAPPGEEIFADTRPSMPRKPEGDEVEDATPVSDAGEDAGGARFPELDLEGSARAANLEDTQEFDKQMFSLAEDRGLETGSEAPDVAGEDVVNRLREMFPGEDEDAEEVAAGLPDDEDEDQDRVSAGFYDISGEDAERGEAESQLPEDIDQVEFADNELEELEEIPSESSTETSDEEPVSRTLEEQAGVSSGDEPGQPEAYAGEGEAGGEHEPKAGEGEKADRAFEPEQVDEDSMSAEVLPDVDEGTHDKGPVSGIDKVSEEEAGESPDTSKVADEIDKAGLESSFSEGREPDGVRQGGESGEVATGSGVGPADDLEPAESSTPDSGQPETGEDTGETSPITGSEEETDAEFVSIPDHVLTPTLADIYYQQGQKELAVRIYRRLIAKNPDNEKLRDRLEQVEREEEPPSAGAPQEHVAAPGGGGAADKPSSPRRRRASSRSGKRSQAAKPLKGVRITKKYREKYRKRKSHKRGLPLK